MENMSFYQSYFKELDRFEFNFDKREFNNINIDRRTDCRDYNVNLNKLIE